MNDEWVELYIYTENLALSCEQYFKNHIINLGVITDIINDEDDSKYQLKSEF